VCVYSVLSCSQQSEMGLEMLIMLFFLWLQSFVIFSLFGVQIIFAGYVLEMNEKKLCEVC
jgi:hypothetical protein